MSTETGRYAVTLSLALTFVLPGCHTDASRADEREMSILSESFETVFRADASLFTGSGALRSIPARTVAFLKLPFADLMMALEFYPDSQLANLLTEGRISSVIGGAKQFRSPVGLGLARATTAYILVFSRFNAIDIRKRVRGSPFTAVASGPVWRWEFPASEAQLPVTFYMCQVNSKHVIVSSSLEDLRLISERLTAGKWPAVETDSLLLPESLRSSPVWGYRRFRDSERGMWDELAGMPIAAKTLALSVDVRSHSAIFRYLARDPGQDRAAELGHPMGAFHLVHTGVWQMTIPLTGEEPSLEQMFIVMGLFGFGISL